MSSNKNICESCSNCLDLNIKPETVTTEHASSTPFEWQTFTEPFCKLLCVGMKAVKKCSHYNKIDLKSIN